jgi:hypothetical protein
MPSPHFLGLIQVNSESSLPSIAYEKFIYKRVANENLIVSFRKLGLFDNLDDA